MTALTDSPLALIEDVEDVGPMLLAQEHQLVELLAEVETLPEAGMVRHRLEQVRRAIILWQDTTSGLEAYRRKALQATVDHIRRMWRVG